MLHQTIKPANHVEDVPLIVDLDGTLLRSDILVESAIEFVREQPSRLLLLLSWLGEGKAALKHHLATQVDLDVSLLPYDQVILDFIAGERLRGRRIVLATASNARIATKVADHLGLFDDVLASDADHNLSGVAKKDRLAGAYGENGFDYIGNSSDDLAVWPIARESYLANAAHATRKHAYRIANVSGEFSAKPSTFANWRRAMRFHQWAKNSLVFAPLLGAHLFWQRVAVLQVCLAFLCFGCCASSVYILNDLLDLKDDRNHPIKRFRPFASGAIPITSGLVAAPLLLALSFWLSFWALPATFMAALGCYYAATLTYSIKLKKLMVIDVVTLAGLYTMRIVAGGLAVSVPLSFWLLALSMFLFFSLAMVKRFAELRCLEASDRDVRMSGRGYIADDLPMIAALGASSGFVAVLVLAFYVNDSRTAQLYRHPQLIWLACPLLFVWVSRAWMLAGRGQMNQDPVVFALRDRVSQVLGLLCALTFVAAV